MGVFDLELNKISIFYMIQNASTFALPGTDYLCIHYVIDSSIFLLSVRWKYELVHINNTVNKM